MMLSLEDKLRFLAAPRSYPGGVQEVTSVETHMSWVFLAGARAYKLKKPVDLPLLNFTTLDAREQNSRDEVRLNRRLAPDIYLGVVPLVRRADNSLALGGAGEVVDWLVEMRRLPEERMLDVMLARQTAKNGHTDRLVEVLVTFYRNAVRPDIDPATHFLCLENQQVLNRQVLSHREYDIDHDMARHVVNEVEAGLHRFRPLIEERMASGRYVEGHGDLRPQHICLTEPIVIFDCLEFNRELRLIDPFDEVAFLGMECNLLGAPWIGDLILEAMKAQLADPIPWELIRFYAAYRAAMRARMALGHLVYGGTTEKAKWECKTDRYIKLAGLYLSKSRSGAGPQVKASSMD